jgi:hypothetical protein
MASLRPVCETIFYFLLLGYMKGIHTQQSISDSERRESTELESSAWKLMDGLATEALRLAIKAAAGNYIQADKSAKGSFRRLKAR